MKKLKVVQIGLGHDHAPDVLESISCQQELFEVVGFAVPESEQEKTKELIRKFRDEKNIAYLTVEKALDYPELDGAVIETEEKNLTKYALMAAKKGLHIHMDKPGGLDEAEFVELITEVKSRQLTFSLGYMYRFNPNIQSAIKKAESGELGEIYCVEAHMDCEHKKEKREWLSQFPGGMMFFLGCHLIDLVYRIQGMPEKVIPYNMATGYEGVEAEDYGMVLFKYPNGISFVKTCASEPGGFKRRQLVICGTKGTIEIKPIESFCENLEKPRNYAYTDMRIAYPNEDWQYDGEFIKSGFYNRYDAMMKNFAEIACGKKTNPYSYEYELELYQLLLKSCGKRGI